MTVITSFKPLFEVKILHHYFLDKGASCFDNLPAEDQRSLLFTYSVSRFFEISPTDECSLILSKHHCIFKTTPTGFLVGVKIKKNDSGDTLPFIDISNDLKFSFFLRISDMNFLNYTALPLLNNSGKIYSFNNLTGGNKKKYPFLSKFAPLYKSLHTYSSGDILSNNNTDPAELYIAKRPTMNDPSSDPGNWQTDYKLTSTGKPLQYANVNDQVPVCKGIFNYYSPTPDPDMTVAVTNKAGVTMKPRLSAMTVANRGNPSTDVTMLQLDFRSLPVDFYTIRPKPSDPSVELPPVEYYYSPSGLSDIFAIIELFVDSDDPSYSLLDNNGFLLTGNGKIVHPVFQVRFKNRSTIWRYLGKKFTPPEETEEPNPLTRSGVIDVELKNSKEVGLANPAVNMIVTETNDEKTAYNIFSETHIN